MCTPPVLELPADTAFVRLRVRSPTRVRPAMQPRPARRHEHLRFGAGAAARRRDADQQRELPDPEDRRRERRRASPRCAPRPRRARWNGSARGVPALDAQSVIARRSVPQPAELAAWFLPAAGAQRSLTSRTRGAIFCPGGGVSSAGAVGAWIVRGADVRAAPGAGAAGECAAWRWRWPRGTGDPPRRRLGVCDRRAELRLLGADHAAVSGARRGRSLRLRAVTGGTRRDARRQRGDSALSLGQRREPGVGSDGLHDRPRSQRHAHAGHVAGAGSLPPAVRTGAPARQRRRRVFDLGGARPALLSRALAGIPARPARLGVRAAHLDAAELRAAGRAGGAVRVPAGARAGAPGGRGSGCWRG